MSTGSSDPFWERRCRLERDYNMGFSPITSKYDPFSVTLYFDVVLPMAAPTIHEITCQITYQIEQCLQTRAYRRTTILLPPTKTRMSVTFDLRRFGPVHDPRKTTPQLIYKAIIKELQRYDNDCRKFTKLERRYQIGEGMAPYLCVQMEPRKEF
ncbi:uncharacterized protein LDX57_011585 [Aspergillus melleus]|uniref:uncharacterized protein n=1 Tax=Aspergillus melleus TaxID=138277 RepID=UPI001E8DC2CA|nr:uncharacterized protein LDX57_011585 [Aspergillus melleus]KAH8433949.1 hypothetical protein LDX57_011585 [Aspergillus melleus]